MCDTPTVQVLWLDNNQIGDVGVMALANACASGSLAQLRGLFLSGNSISDKAKGTMRTTMSKRSGNVHL